MIETERLVLRPFVESDAEDVVEYLHQPAVHCFNSMKLDSLEAAKAEILYRNGLLERCRNAVEVMILYKTEIEAERARMNASRNGFVRTCCQQTIDQLMAEKRAIEAELVG